MLQPLFIYDWYWYDGRPFLEQCLNDGYLKAKNNHRVKFYLMWANHDVTHLWDKRISNIEDNIIWRGATDRKQFENVAHRVIDRYFGHEAYYKMDGKPVFMIYELANLVAGLGGVDATRKALEWFREAVGKAGHPGLHLQLTTWGAVKTAWGADSLDLRGIDPAAPVGPAATVRKFGFDSQSHYQMAHFTNIDRNYADIIPDMEKEWALMEKTYDIPYFPHVSVGWDNNPRFQSLKPGVVKNNKPELFGRALELARAYADRHPKQAPLITINSWNEWTEGSHLEPDDLNGYGYLEAVKKVFVPAR